MLCIQYTLQQDVKCILYLTLNINADSPIETLDIYQSRQRLCQFGSIWMKTCGKCELILHILKNGTYKFLLLLTKGFSEANFYNECLEILICLWKARPTSIIIIMKLYVLSDSLFYIMQTEFWTKPCSH